MSAPRLQPLTRGKVAALGEAGHAWQAALPGVLDELAAAWGLELGRPLPGGSASYVVGARTEGGEERVLKVVLPDPELAPAAVEAAVLGAAGGRGYAVLHAHDERRGALLLERLGPSLDAPAPSGEPRPTEEVLDAVVDVLLEAWRVPPAVGLPAPDRAGRLLATIEQRQAELGRPVDDVVLRAVRGCVERLSVDAAQVVVNHADAHPGNVLRRAGGGWALVDPDGLLLEPAHDVGVLLRDWTARLEGSGARERLAAWTRRAAERSGTDPARVADWALLERVSTGLYVLSLGADRLGRRFLDSAAALV